MPQRLDAYMMNLVHNIMHKAEKQIKEHVGYDVRLILHNVDLKKGPRQMLTVLTRALDMTAGAYKVESRKTAFVQLKQLGNLFLSRYFPEMTLRERSILLGYRDHTTLIYHANRLEELFELKDPEIMEKYNRVEDTIARWVLNLEEVADNSIETETETDGAQEC